MHADITGVPHGRHHVNRVMLTESRQYDLMDIIQRLGLWKQWSLF